MLFRSRKPNPPNWGALKITMQQFYRPSGESTQKRGVLSDIVLPSITSQMDVGEADLDYALDFDQVRSTLSDKDKYNMVDANVLAMLRERSASRRNESADFQKLGDNIRRYREHKERKSVTLNESGSWNNAASGTQIKRKRRNCRTSSNWTVRCSHGISIRTRSWRSRWTTWSCCTTTTTTWLMSLSVP